MDYGERFNYGKIKDDFGYLDDKGYYSSTYTSFDSKLNQIPSLEDLQKEYPDRIKTYRWGKGNKCFVTYDMSNPDKPQILEADWFGLQTLQQENESLQKILMAVEKKLKDFVTITTILKIRLTLLKRVIKIIKEK